MSDKPTPIRAPEPPSMQAFHEAMENVKKSMANMQQTNPFVKALEGVDRELARTHTTIQAKLTERKEVYNDEEYLKKLRDKYLQLIDELTTKKE